MIVITGEAIQPSPQLHKRMLNLFYDLKGRWRTWNVFRYVNM